MSTGTGAETGVDTGLAGLNRDVWEPFVAAYAARDAEAFLAVHHPDLVRASGPARQVHTFASYAAEITGWFADMAARGTGLSIEFRFTERFVTGDLACERGVFRIDVTPEGDAAQVFFGRFHTFARRDGGRWRILTDYDTHDGHTVGEEAFRSAHAQGDLGPFATS